MNQLKTFVGLRLEIIDGDGVGGYSSVWKVSTGTTWTAWPGLTISQFNAKHQELLSQNFELTYISFYEDGFLTKCAGIWDKNIDGHASFHGFGFDLTNLHVNLIYWANFGFHLKHINSYQYNGNILYAAIWESNTQKKIVKAELSSLGFNNEIQNYHTTGFEIKHVTGASRNGQQSLFLGVWENLGVWNEVDLINIGNYVNNYMFQFSIKGSSLAIVKDGRLVYAKGFGVMDVATQDPAGSKTLFRVASVSKPITSATLMTIIEKYPSLLSSTILGPNGILGTKYGTVPYAETEKIFTLQQLLEHTAAGTAWSQNNEPMMQNTNYNLKQFIDWVLNDMNPNLWPGTYYAYSNFGYCLLGRVIEKLSGISYESYVQENVLKQCGITDMQIGGNWWTDKRYTVLHMFRQVLFRAGNQGIIKIEPYQYPF